MNRIVGILITLAALVLLAGCAGPGPAPDPDRDPNNGSRYTLSVIVTDEAGHKLAQDAFGRYEATVGQKFLLQITCTKAENVPPPVISVYDGYPEKTLVCQIGDDCRWQTLKEGVAKLQVSAMEPGKIFPTGCDIFIKVGAAANP